MSNLVFVSGDFSSGTTLLFTLFRKTGDYYCLYEPLHEKLLEYLIYPLRPDPHHPFVEPYYDEYKGFSKIPQLYNPAWGNSHLYLPSSARADDFLRYWSYLIGTAFGRGERVMLKENRLTFRLRWLKAQFPYAKIVHIYRDKDGQWNSIVRRGQEYLGREDIGQDTVTFGGFSLATWSEDLKSVFPELDASRSSSGYERFSKLWDLSFAEHQKFADISVDLRSLTHDFEATCARIGECIDYDFDVAALKPYVLTPELAPAATRSARATPPLQERRGQRWSQICEGCAPRPCAPHWRHRRGEPAPLTLLRPGGTLWNGLAEKGTCHVCSEEPDP